MNFLRRILTDEKGQVAPLFALLLMFIIGLTVLAVDGGRVVYLENKAFNIAEASALSIRDYLSQSLDESVVKTSAIEYAIANGAESSDVNVSLEYDIILEDGSRANRAVIVVDLTHEMIFGGVVGVSDREVNGRYTITVPIVNLDDEEEVKNLAKEFVEAVGKFDNSELGVGCNLMGIKGQLRI